MKKLRDLTADDFPGCDPSLFEEWKKLQTGNWKKVVLWLLSFFVLVKVCIAIGGIWPFLPLLWFFGYAGIVLLPSIVRMRRIQKETGINRASVRQALKG